MEIADAQPVRFPGFDALTLDYPQLQAVIRDHRYAAWRMALASVIGVYLITDTRTGKHYVGKADGQRTSSNGGPSTRATATAATLNSATSTRQASGSRSSESSTPPPPRPKSTQPKATSNMPSTRADTGSTAISQRDRHPGPRTSPDAVGGPRTVVMALSRCKPSTSNHHAT